MLQYSTTTLRLTAGWDALLGSLRCWGTDERCISSAQTAAIFGTTIDEFAHGTVLAIVVLSMVTALKSQSPLQPFWEFGVSHRSSYPLQRALLAPL
jgi:hypothetical protein